MDKKIKKINTNNFEIEEMSVVSVDKKVLKKEISDMKEMIEKKREAVGLVALEKDLQDKEDLLASLK